MVDLGLERPVVTTDFYNTEQPLIDFGRPAGRIGQLRSYLLLWDTASAPTLFPFYVLWQLSARVMVGRAPAL